MTLSELRTWLDNCHRADAVVAGIGPDAATYRITGIELEVHENAGGNATLWLQMEIN